MNRPELLAPAGNWEAFEAVIQAGADAVYLGGKNLNMRQWRSDLNFTEDQIREAVGFAHQRGARVYVTVNNLYFDGELDGLARHLEFLEGAGVDALIAQDLAVAGLARELGITRPLHASVQVGVSNHREMELLKQLGFSRVIVTRDLSLEQVWNLTANSDLEIECFIHGELCVSQTGQCLASSLIFGESGNRGRCMKPCRWRYKAFAEGDNGKREYLDLPGEYLLGCKDLNLYQYIPDMVQAGIVCFKIEGRMRPGSFLGPLVSTYRRALDRYLDDPLGYRMDREEWKRLHDSRIRELTPGRLWGDPGAGLFDYTGAREPQFPTRPIEHPVVSVNESSSPAGKQPEGTEESGPPFPIPALGVRVSRLDSVEPALKSGARVIYLGGEDAEPWGIGQVREAVSLIRGYRAEAVYATPRIAHRRELGEYRSSLEGLIEAGIDGLMAANWGFCQMAAEIGGIPVYGDYPLNLSNRAAVRAASGLGLKRAAVSVEVPIDQLLLLLRISEMPLELVVHGPLAAMTINSDLAAVIKEAALPVGDGSVLSRLSLEDEAGEVYPLEVDRYGRTHVMFSQPLCWLPYLPSLVPGRPALLRLEAGGLDAGTTGRLVDIYRRHIESAAKDPTSFRVETSDWEFLARLAPRGYTAGALGC
ncbi:MAG: hypothetical protein HPY50_11830 [Firmicutes bacterium]|nr:hypothetical protein [Bacillota bacterium]